MLTLAFSMVAYIRAFFGPRHQLALEAAALRQQLAVLKRNQTHLRLHCLDRFFWTALRRVYSGWAEALIIVKPETVVSWHRAGFRLFWRWRSRQLRPGRPKVSGEIRQLIGRMKAENPTWGAPRIHGELLQFGFTIAEPTVSRYLQQLKPRPDEGKAQQWLAFLNNHRELIGAFDFFTVPSLTFRTLYCFLSSRTIDGESCTSMSRHIRRPIGSCNNSARLFLFPAPTGTSCSTGMANSVAMFSSS